MRLRAEIKEFAMSRNGSGVYSLPPGSTAVDDAIIDPVVFNTLISDLESDANTARPIVAGGTGATTAAAARTNLGATAVGASVFTAADAAAARSAIGAPPTPQLAGGVGNWFRLYTTASGNVTLPAGGSWAWLMIRRNASTGGIVEIDAGVNAGGFTRAALTSNEDANTLVWRLS
jgi:hypothetical protein